MVSPCGRSRDATRWGIRATCGRSSVGSPSARPPVTLQGGAAGSGGSWIDAAVGVQASQRRTAVVEELADADHLAKTAPVTAGAARVGDEPLFEDEHRRARLEELDRGVGGAGRPEQRRLPIGPR